MKKTRPFALPCSTYLRIQFIDTLHGTIHVAVQKSIAHVGANLHRVSVLGHVQRNIVREIFSSFFMSLQYQIL